MLLDTVESYIVSTVIGLLFGIIIARYYYEKTRNFAVGKAIEGALISGNIDALINYCKDLESLLSKMNSETNTLLDQIKRCGDIETMLSEPFVTSNDFEDVNTMQFDKNSVKTDNNAEKTESVS